MSKIKVKYRAVHFFGCPSAPISQNNGRQESHFVVWIAEQYLNLLE